MNNYIKHKELLYKSFDFELSAEEKNELEAALETHPDLREEKSKIEKLRSLLRQDDEIEHDSVIDSVMEEISRQQPQGVVYELHSLFPRIAAACLIAILSFLLSIYISDGELNGETITGISEYSMDDIELLYD